MKRRSRTPVAAAVLVLMAAACAPADPGMDNRGRRVDALFSHLDRGVQPGLSIAVVQDGEIVFASGYGMANLEQRVPNTPSTVFDIASISKQFAGMSIAMLVEDGAISLDDDVRRYIPEMADFGTPITIDHLVHHTSGLRDWPGTLAIGGWQFDDVISFDQILDFAYHQRELNFEPGAEYTYSNTGYNLLAEVVARVGGQSFREWTDERLFQPLGMTSTHFHDDHTEVVPRRASGYASDGDGGFQAVANNLTALGSSSLYTTVEDLARWIANFETADVGGSEVMAMTRTRGVLNDGAEIPYAFGISHGEYRGVPMVRHSGSWASFRTELIHFPEERLGVVILANTGIDTAQRARDVVDIYLADVLSEGAEDEPQSEARSVQVEADVLARYEGTYRLGAGWYLTLRQDGGTLQTQATRERTFPTTPRSQTEFWVEAYGASLHFPEGLTGPAPWVEYRGTRAPRMGTRSEPTAARLAQFVGEYESAELRTSYTVSRQDGLVLSHPRHGDIELEPAWGDDFVGSEWFIGSVEFIGAESGPPTGFLVNAGERNRNIRFTRRQ